MPHIKLQADCIAALAFKGNGGEKAFFVATEGRSTVSKLDVFVWRSEIPT